jgi:hypothetical protein
MLAESIDPAVWGLIGTAVGALILGVGNYVVHRDERDERVKREQREIAERAERERREAATHARDERKEVYIRLLGAARQLRYCARHGSVFNVDEIDSLRSELSNAHYEIELIAPTEVVSRADVLVRGVLNYVNVARRNVSPTDNTVRDSPALQEKRKAARSAVNDFLLKTREELSGLVWDERHARR